MPVSIEDHAVRDAVAAAKTAHDVTVPVGTEMVTFRTPFPSPYDWRDVWIYHLLLDRFNRPGGPPAGTWNRQWLKFQGGTFNGVRQQLDYLKGLGVGAIWLSPCMKNCRYHDGTFHGYGIQDFLRLDPRFASAPGQEEREFRALVDEAHAREMYVIADIVLNHAGDVFQYECDGDGHCESRDGAEAGWQDEPYTIYWRDENGQGRRDWTQPPADPGVSRDAVVWPRELQRNDFFRRKGLGGEGGGDFASLKEFVTTYPTVRNVLITAHQYFVAKYDVDGFRIDTLKYIERDFARIFANAVREYALRIGKKNFLTYGEVWENDDEEKIARYVGRYAHEAAELVGVDAALDFPLAGRLPSMAKAFTAPAELVGMYQYRKQVQRNVVSSHGEASRFFVTFLDNHDYKRRFRNSQTDEWDDQLTLALGCLFSLQGIPCVYYGTEQGLNGTREVYENGGHHDWMVREALWGKPNAFDPGNKFCQTIRRLSQTRTDHPALRYGRQYFRPISGDQKHFGISPYKSGVLAFSRILNDEEVLAVANTHTLDEWSGQVIVDMSLSAHGIAYRVLFSNKPPAQVTAPDPAGTVSDAVVHEVTGNVNHGAARCVTVHLKPMEMQILTKA